MQDEYESQVDGLVFLLPTHVWRKDPPTPKAAMTYLILTLAVGLLMAGLSLASAILVARQGGIFINQLRFLISGLVLAAHFPLTHWIGSMLEPYMAVELVPEAEQLSYWTAVAILVTAQLVILPTRRELYMGFFADRLTRTA